jgi:hypothetical protein
MKIIIQLKKCKDCRTYHHDTMILEHIARDIMRQLKEVSVTIRSNNVHIRRIYLEK